MNNVKVGLLIICLLLAFLIIQVTIAYTGEFQANTGGDEIDTTPQDTMRDVAIGDTLNDLIESLGEPNRKDLSRFGFDWFIYNRDYKKYLQVGIKDDEVVALAGTIGVFGTHSDISSSIDREEIHSIFGVPDYTIERIDGFNLATDDDKNYNIAFYYDTYLESQVYFVKIISDEFDLFQYSNMIEDEFDDDAIDIYLDGIERRVIDHINSIRADKGKSTFIWHQKLAEIARKHSYEMSKNDFSHIGMDGKFGGDRIMESGIDYEDWNENISRGQNSAANVVNFWFNSPFEEHRKQLLDDYTFSSVGISLSSENEMLTTLKSFSSQKSDDYMILINGEEIEFERSPEVIEGEILVPVGTLLKAMDVEMEWESSTETIIGNIEDITIELQIDSTKAYINDKKYQLSVPVQQKEKVIFAPIRFVGESFENQVKWDESGIIVVNSF